MSQDITNQSPDGKYKERDEGSPAHSKKTILKPQSPVEYVAYGISQLGSPPILGLLPLILIVTSPALPAKWVWTGIYLLLAIIIPLAFLVWQVVRGHVTDLDIHLREQRKATLRVTIVGFGTAWIALAVGRAHPFLIILAATGFLQWLAIYLITLHWKISVHAASATGISLLMIRMFGTPTVPMLISIPLVAWSRIRLRHHTPAQTFAGVCLGLAIFALAVLLTPGL